MKEISDIQILDADKKPEGRGAEVLRAFPSRDFSHLDPFVLMDEFFVEPSAGFPLHFHSGFEAITYMLEGSFRHEDTAGNESTVGQGGLQRITMGSGIKHSEQPASEGMTHGIQLWVNLPRDLKGVEPSYEVLPAEELGVKRNNSVREKILVDSDAGPEVQAEIGYRDIIVENSEWIWSREGRVNQLLYILKGNVTISVDSKQLEVNKGQAAIKGLEVGLEPTILVEGTAQFIALRGKPLGEPINQRGSSVA